MNIKSNPLLNRFSTPFEVPPFNHIQEEHFAPAIIEGIRISKDQIDAIANDIAHPTFENTIVALEEAGTVLSQITSIFFNLNSAETSEGIQKIAQEVSPLLTQYSNDILLNEKLFQRVKKVWESKRTERLSKEDIRLLDKTYKSFKRNGALLSNQDKEQLREIDKNLSVLSLTFGEHLLAETKKFELIVDDEKALLGLPEYVKEAALSLAKERGYKSKWVFTLDAPSYIPFVTYCDDRGLRKEINRACNVRCFQGDQYDNREIVKQVVNHRLERANLLGYDSYAHFILEERMAETPEDVNVFLERLLEHSLSAGEKDISDVEAFAKEADGIDELQKWDYNYYAEKLKKECFDIDDEILKPYFKLENVIQGAFEVAERLFGLKFIIRQDLPVYHEDVTVYEVLDRDGSLISIFYADFFPRAGKRNGAWMTSYRGQKILEGNNVRPIVSIVCNFPKSTDSLPSLLNFNDVLTLFHEFGHGLHGMLANTKYESLSGTNVYWDFVELPSQVMENWCSEKECLDMFARHYETGELIPETYIQRIKESASFQEGYKTVRQVGFALLDMAWHGTKEHITEEVRAFERKVFDVLRLMPEIEEGSMSTSFAHIFQGGYSAAYYSYKWAEVLDADAFELFKEKGIFDKETALKFRALLAAGGTVHPMELYKSFRGRQPNISALLKRAGLQSVN
jgi:peptidyl-dipeptidase Dcp